VGEHHYCEGWSFLSQAGADFSDSLHVRIDLNNAVLRGSFLNGADLSVANLSNASLLMRACSRRFLRGPISLEQISPARSITSIPPSRWRDV
jgi:hypothetical protein